VILESIRRKDLWVVAIIGFLVVASAGGLGFFGSSGMATFAKDLASSVLGFFSTLFAVFVSCRVMPEELRHRTLYPLMARPITRGDLLIGKWLGTVAVAWVGFLCLAALVGVALAFFGVEFAPVMAQYVIARMLGLALVCALGIALSLYVTPAAAATLAILLVFGSNVLLRAFDTAQASASAPVTWMIAGLEALAPRFSLFDLGARAASTNLGPIPAWAMLALAMYALVYAAFLIVVAWLRFRRQAL
jgi:ABC-type transport system involved in multi-copper enzyme maturation permease subunit